MDEVCRHVPKLSITADLPTKVQIHNLASGDQNTRKETTQVQLELNLQIVEAQPSAPLEVKEQSVSAI